MKLLDSSTIELLRSTSRTFFVPIIRLPGDLRAAVGSAYLCMRAIDEIEDHKELDAATKADLLEQVSVILGTARDEIQLEALTGLFEPYRDVLPKVTCRLAHHAMMAPETAARLVWASTSEMAQRMAHWVRNEWQVVTESDLDEYTFDVAGRVGLLLTSLWEWYDGTRADRDLAIGFGRGLQAVNIMRNRGEDVERGVNFFPDSWDSEDMESYTRRQLAMGEAYLEALPSGPAREFCSIPLKLAFATLDALYSGHEKLTRARVLELIESCTGEPQSADARVGD